jgi:phage tail-like protein
MAASRTQNYALKPASGDNPLPVYKFWVEIASIVVAEFQECSGLRAERDIERFHEGGVNHHEQILVKGIKYTNITLKYGITSTHELWDWFNAGLLDGKVKKIDFSILLRNVGGEVARRWNIASAFPVRWEGPQFTSDSNQIAIETIEIAHYGITLG